MAQAQRGKKAILACYSTGSRARITSILAEAQSPGPAMADTWQEALGIAANKRVTPLSCRLKPAFPATRSRSSPSRICWATVWSGARRRKIRRRLSGGIVGPGAGRSGGSHGPRHRAL
jgi:hypothetical protein